LPSTKSRAHRFSIIDDEWPAVKAMLARWEARCGIGGTGRGAARPEVKCARRFR
jgi:hypothetical protein